MGKVLAVLGAFLAMALGRLWIVRELARLERDLRAISWRRENGILEPGDNHEADKPGSQEAR
jgi:hypothetical protein